jgi:Flp pilus assembly protein TadG
MQPENVAGRARGQVLVIMALALVGLMGITGVAVDMGYAYTHRREVQNAADAAALAGAIKLGQHYNAVRNSSGSLPTPTPGPQTDATIMQDVTNAAVAALPPFPSPNTNQTWPPTGTTGTNTLTAFYMTGDGTQGAQITTGSSAPPSTAVGVRVVATASYPTFFARILGPAFQTVPVTGQARAMLRPVLQASGGPFIVCGGSANPAPPTGDPDVGSPKKILTPQPAPQPWTIGPNFVGNDFLLQSSQLNNDNADCGDSGFHGNADPTAPCDPTGTSPLPCNLPDEQGDRAGPTRNLVSGLPGCSGITADTGCVLILPIADRSPGNGVMEIVTYAAFTIYRGDSAGVSGCTNSNCHWGVLLGAAMIDGPAGSGVIDPTNPGVFTVQLSPE